MRGKEEIKAYVMYQAQEKGTYSYEVLGGMPVEFTKEELNQYLHDRRKVVDIVVSISMQRNSEKIGDLLYIDP